MKSPAFNIHWDGVWLLHGCYVAPFKGAARGRRSLSCGGPRLSVLQNGFHFSDGPAFVSRYHTYPVEGEVGSPGKICHREPSSSSTMWLSEWDRTLMARSFRVGGQCVVQSATSVPTGPPRSSCWGLACWLRGGRPHSPPQRRACRGQPCGRRRRRQWRP